MVGRDVQHIRTRFKVSATVACHCGWVLCIAHLPFAADVLPPVDIQIAP